VSSGVGGGWRLLEKRNKSQVLRSLTLQQSTDSHDDGTKGKTPSSTEVFTKGKRCDAAEEATNYDRSLQLIST